MSISPSMPDGERILRLARNTLPRSGPNPFVARRSHGRKRKLILVIEATINSPRGALHRQGTGVPLIYRTMNTILPLIATCISSVALIGVALGLTLQARQLRAGRLQAIQVMQLELIKIGIDNPGILPYSVRNVDSEDVSQSAYLNLWVKYLETAYEFGAVTKAAIDWQLEQMFESEFTRAWWAATGRDAYKTDAGTKSRKNFFAMVDSAFQAAIRSLGPSNVANERATSED
jgi:hypothetical protein